MKITLQGKEQELVPMSWKMQKAVFQIISEGLAKWADVKDMAANIVRSAMTGEEKPLLKSITDILNELPEIATDAMALALGVDKAVLDEAAGIEFTRALTAVIEVNDLEEQWATLKKVSSLLLPAAKAKQGEEKK